MSDEIARESKPTIEPGDCVFFRDCRDSMSENPLRVRAKGLFFGILLGILPPLQKPPPAEYLVRAMGDLGYITFDDLAEFLGEANTAAIMERWKEKYVGTKEQQAKFAKEIESRKNAAPVLVDNKGQTITSENETH